MAAQTQALLRRSFSVQFHGGSLAEWHGCWETNARTRVQEYALVFPFKKIGCQTSSCHASMPVLSSAVCACKSMCNLCFVCVCVRVCLQTSTLCICIYICVYIYMYIQIFRHAYVQTSSIISSGLEPLSQHPLQKGQQKECTKFHDFNAMSFTVCSQQPHS